MSASTTEERRKRFQSFHAQNPFVFRALRKFALEAKRAGLKRIGIRLPWERLRWSVVAGKIKTSEDFRLNDWFTSHYSRLLMQQEPRLRGFFEIRGRAA